jgi:hypothetical protein
MEPQDVATALVRTRFPNPVAAFLTGSVAAGSTTSTSDLDIVVVVEDEAAEWRETTRVEGWLVELFVHTEVSLCEWYVREAAEHDCTLAHMVATGVAITGATEADALIRQARAHVEHGPPPRTREQIDAQRYHLTAAVDDLLGCSDGGERVFIAGQVTEMIGQLTLANRDAWSGSGKWLYRWLESIDLDLARRLADGCRAAGSSADVRPLDQVATEVLAAAGGRLQEGYRLG